MPHFRVRGYISFLGNNNFSLRIHVLPANVLNHLTVGLGKNRQRHKPDKLPKTLEKAHPTVQVNSFVILFHAVISVKLEIYSSFQSTHVLIQQMTKILHSIADKNYSVLLVITIFPITLHVSY